MQPQLIGPFQQIVTLANLPLKGALEDEQLEIIPQGGVWVEGGKVKKTGVFSELLKTFPEEGEVQEISWPMVALPGFVDCHTHLCFGGTRSRDYALRVAGKPYLEIARQGGGIWDTVTKTRGASEKELLKAALQRVKRHLKEGITTLEIKSGYGLNPEQELKMLRVIQQLSQKTPADIVATCLAAHIKPKDFEQGSSAYLEMILSDLLPQIKKEKLANRIDIFIEETAFLPEESKPYLQQAKQLGFEITVHADQFHAGGSAVAVEVGAASADHLEASTEREIQLLANSETVAVALPGASLGLGCPFTPARKLLDGGACLAIASDWNPGSAPMGDLLTQAAILGTFEKLSTAETLSGMTFRAAKALQLTDRGTLAAGQLADIQAYPTSDYREILYHQGKMKPVAVWKEGIITNYE